MRATTILPLLNAQKFKLLEKKYGSIGFLTQLNTKKVLYMEKTIAYAFIISRCSIDNSRI